MPLAPLVDRLARVAPLPPLINRDTLSILEHTYLGDSSKAQRELGWSTRPPAEGFRQTFDEIARTTQPLEMTLGRPNRRQLAIVALGLALGVSAAWVLTRPRNR
jgi:hypothetical protein